MFIFGCPAIYYRALSSACYALVEMLHPEFGHVHDGRLFIISILFQFPYMIH
jgi:hypothetical protein